MSPISSNPHSHPDARIDQILHALRATTSPGGLESRIAARLSQAAESQTAEARTLTASPFAVKNHRASTSFFATTDRHPLASFFAVILSLSPKGDAKEPRILLAPARRYPLAAALTLLLTISTLTLLHHRTPATTITLTPTSSPHFEVPALQPLRKRQLALKGRNFSPAATRQINPALAAEGISTRPHQPSGPEAIAPANTQVAQGFSLGSHSPTQTAGVLTPAPPDPDTIALVETRAPSHPAPPMPLTPQEHLLQSATQKGAPIELAELDLAREPILRAAAATRDRAGLQQFVHSLVSQLITSESLDPLSHHDSQPAPEPVPTSSSTNEPQTNGAPQ